MNKNANSAVFHRAIERSLGPILFLYYEESLVSSNLNSKLFRFHSAHPNQYMGFNCFESSQIISITRTKIFRLKNVTTFLIQTIFLNFKFELVILKPEQYLSEIWYSKRY